MSCADPIVQVLLPLPHTEPFDYQVPLGIEVPPGSFVTVPFRNREVVGVVWGTAPTCLDTAKIKTLLACLNLPPLSAEQLRFIRWVADYSVFSYSSVLRMVMPVTPGNAEPKTHTAYTLGANRNIRMTRERERVIGILHNTPPMTLAAIQKATQVSASVVQNLKRLAVLKEVTLTPAPPPPDQPVIHLPQLSGQQQEAARYLHTQIVAARYSVTVIDGVTGSGKTEVYFTAIADILQQAEGQVLILLPEIALTSQFLSRFEARFGFRPAEWHSDISDKARRDIWHGVLEGRVRLVVGARSALFLPFASLRLIVVDEEHESAYKQEEGVLYHARDMAVVRAYLGGFPVILASATPSLETVMNIQAGKFTCLTLPSRYGEAVMPVIEVVDMRTTKREKQHWLAPSLRTALAKTLENGQQSLLYLNRRGYAPLTLCRTCGHRMACPSCSSWMVEHRTPRRLECHHCGYRHPIPRLCPACGEEGTLVACGPGVERVAEEVQSLLPQARLLLMTRDTVKTIKAAEQVIQSILDKQVDIIIGTQMVAKGHHFPALTLVGVVDADLGLAGGDLRAAERTYQLLHQVSGRAGREQLKGKVILQSYMPDNSIIQALVAGERDRFMANEIANRNASAMPPFSRLAALILSGENEQHVVATAKALARTAPIMEGVEVLGPAPAMLYQLRKKFRYRLLMKTKRDIQIQKLLKHWLAHTPLHSSVQVKIDIDPYSFF